MSIDTIVIDKYGFIRALQEKGFSHQQAEGLAEAIGGVAFSQLVSKADLKDFELRLYKNFAGILITHAMGTATLTVALIQLFR